MPCRKQSCMTFAASIARPTANRDQDIGAGFSRGRRTVDNALARAVRHDAAIHADQPCSQRLDQRRQQTRTCYRGGRHQEGAALSQAFQLPWNDERCPFAMNDMLDERKAMETGQVHGLRPSKTGLLAMAKGRW